MDVVFTIGMLVIAYQLTVNVRNKREIKNLRNKVFEIDQKFEMVLIYGKDKSKKEEAFKEEERLIDQQHAGESTEETVE